MSAPTVKQYATLSNFVYKNGTLGAQTLAPVGWTAAANGQVDKSTGFQATAFQSQSDPNTIVIAYAGTTPNAGAIGSDILLSDGDNMTANAQALAFAEHIEDMYPDASIYVTGHSLGGEEAEYVKMNLGDAIDGGATFAAPGVPNAEPDQGLTDSNWTNYVIAGDVIGNFTPADGDHYGNSVTLSPPQTSSGELGAEIAAGYAEQGDKAAALGILVAEGSLSTAVNDHLMGTYEQALGMQSSGNDLSAASDAGALAAFASTSDAPAYCYSDGSISVDGNTITFNDQSVDMTFSDNGKTETTDSDGALNDYYGGGYGGSSTYTDDSADYADASSSSGGYDWGFGGYGEGGYGYGYGGDGGENDGTNGDNWTPNEVSGGYQFTKAANLKGSDIGIIASTDNALHAPTAAAAASRARAEAAQLADESLQGLGTSAHFEGAKWAFPKSGSEVVTWSLADLPGPKGSPFSSYLGSTYLAEVEKAFDAWSAASGITFKQVPDSAQSDIRVGFGAFDTAQSGVSGYTSFREKNGALAPGAVVRLEDPSEDPLVENSSGGLTYSKSGVDFSQLLEHEIGHALGLANNADPTSVMYYMQNPIAGGLNQQDELAIESLYGTAGSHVSTSAIPRSDLAGARAEINDGLLASTKHGASLVQALAVFAPAGGSLSSFEYPDSSTSGLQIVSNQHAAIAH